MEIYGNQISKLHIDPLLISNTIGLNLYENNREFVSKKYINSISLENIFLKKNFAISTSFNKNFIDYSYNLNIDSSISDINTGSKEFMYNSFLKNTKYVSKSNINKNISVEYYNNRTEILNIGNLDFVFNSSNTLLSKLGKLPFNRNSSNITYYN